MSGPYRIDLLSVGRSSIPGPQVFWMADWQEWHEIRFQAALLRGDGVTALVNTGPSQDLSLHVNGERGFFGEGARLWRDDGEFIVDLLAGLGVAPAAVTHVILAPLTYYAAANLKLFGNAQIAISRTGWLHFQVTNEHPHDDHGLLPDELWAHLVTDAWPRVRLLGDEDELAPGLRTWWTGGHHRSSLCVDVDAGFGTVAITDAVFVLGNLRRNHPIGICSSLEEALRAQRRLVASGATVLPLYDPENFVRFPGGAVTAADPSGSRG
jgi:hypothetical protein